MKGTAINDIAIDAATLGGFAPTSYFRNYSRFQATNYVANQWYRIARIETGVTPGSSVIVCLNIYQGDQTITQSYLISRNTSGGVIRQIGASNYKNSNLQIRVVKVNDGEFYIDFMNPFGSTYRVDCSVMALTCVGMELIANTTVASPSGVECTLTGSSTINSQNQNSMMQNNVVEQQLGGV